MKITRESGFLMERSENGDIEYALRVSDIAQVKRDDRKVYANEKWTISERRTEVLTQIGTGHCFHSDIENIWQLIQSEEA